MDILEVLQILSAAAGAVQTMSKVVQDAHAKDATAKTLSPEHAAIVTDAVQSLGRTVDSPTVGGQGWAPTGISAA